MSDLEQDARARADAAAVDKEERLERIERLLLLIAKALLSTPMGVEMPYEQVEELRDLLLEKT